jgi:hypothetical protein
MRDSLTRSHLKDLEGQKVLFKSHYESRKKAIDGCYKVLLSNVKIALWTSEVPIDRMVFTHNCDHCWVVVPEITYKGIHIDQMRVPRYSKGYGIGVVSYYTRNDHSIDLSINPLSFIAMEHMRTLNPDLSNLSKVLTCYKYAYDKALNGNLLLVSQFYTRAQCLAELKKKIRDLEGITRSQTLKYLNGARHKPITSPKSFKHLLSLSNCHD